MKREVGKTLLSSDATVVIKNFVLELTSSLYHKMKLK